MRLARIIPLFLALLLVSCFSAHADEPLPNRPDVSSAQPTEIDLDVGTLPSKGPPKLESALWQLVEAERQGGAAGLSTEAQHWGIALHDGAVRVIIVAKDGQAASAVASARSLGATVETSYDDLVQLVAPVATLERLADDPSVKYVRQPFKAQPWVVSEGVPIIRADDWHAAGITASGVKAAVLDLGFEGYASLLGTELPASVTTHSCRGDGDITGDGEVHGTAVAEIVHDVAPDAQMYLVNSETDVEFLNCVDWLIAQDVDVINFSAGWTVIGPGDGTGYINDKVSQAVSSGIVWANAAGNEAQSHWTGPWTNTNGNDWNDFAQSPRDETNAFSGIAGYPIAITLKWDDPFGASGNDYDLCLFDDTLTILACSVNVQDGDDDPVEGIAGTLPYTGIYHIGIAIWDADALAKFHLYQWPGFPMQYVVASGSLCIPADNADAVTVGAVSWSDPNTIEPYSSQGPTDDYRIKPDLVALDEVSGATYGSSGFPGTSAASPHVAGAAALVKQAYPSYSPVEIKSFLEGRAVDLGAAGKDNVYGSGRLDLGDPPIVDADGDTVPDDLDNCPETYDTSNADTDGDAVPGTQPPPGATWGGDACDADDDNDTVLDGDDVDPLDEFACQDLDTDTCDDCSVLGMADPSQDGTDTDSDGACDAGDPDDDNDGFDDAVEDYVGTDPLDDCTDNPGVHDAWPLDIDITKDVSVTGDVFYYRGRIGATPGLPEWWQRLDLDMSADISVTGDVFMYRGRIGETCT